MKIKELILKLEELDQEQEVYIYQGFAQEFTSDYGWECTDSDEKGIQVFFNEDQTND